MNTQPKSYPEAFPKLMSKAMLKVSITYAMFVVIGVWLGLAAFESTSSAHPWLGICLMIGVWVFFFTPLFISWRYAKLFALAGVAYQLEELKEPKDATNA